MKKYILLFASGILATLPASIFAWGYVGHAVVAEIAEEHLSEEVAVKVSKILEGKTLAETASWADQVRRDRRETAPFHYVNISADTMEVSPSDFQQDIGNVYMAVVGYSAILTNSTATQEERKEALMYVNHFIGDLHQPLHCGYAEDRGGNSVNGEFFGESTNLHRLWDSGIIAKEYGDLPPGEIADKIMSSVSPQDKEGWGSDQNVINWMMESKNLLLDDFYPANHETQEFSFGQEYQDRHLPTTQKRLAQAGLRLATTLNLLLADEPQFPFVPLETALPIEGTDSTQIMPPLFGEAPASQPAASKPTSQPASKPASQPTQ